MNIGIALGFLVLLWGVVEFSKSKMKTRLGHLSLEGKGRRELPPDLLLSLLRALAWQYKFAMVVLGVTTIITTVLVAYLVISAFQKGDLVNYFGSGLGSVIGGAVLYSAYRFYDRARQDILGSDADGLDSTTDTSNGSHTKDDSSDRGQS